MTRFITVHGHAGIDWVFNTFQFSLPEENLRLDAIVSFKRAYGKIKKMLELATTTGGPYKGIVLFPDLSEEGQAAELMSMLHSDPETKDLAELVWFFEPEDPEEKREKKIISFGEPAQNIWRN